MTDVDQQAAADRAARAVDKILWSYVPDALRPDVTRRILAALAEQGWRHVPRPPDHLRPHAPPQEAAEAARRGAQLARQALNSPPEDSDA